MKKPQKLVEQLRNETIRFCRIVPAREVMERIATKILTINNSKEKNHASIN